MKHKIIILTCVSLILSSQFPIFNSTISAQTKFAKPLDGEICLSATFAEFRMNHFHAGLDIRTGGEIGRAVYAAEDGYVSRVSISPWGGGKILYINHNNGYTTVYMHLSSFTGELGKAVLDEQYSKQSFRIDKRFAPNEFPVKRGQIVARSGNTGGSAGPHLHFEVRETSTNRTINPLRMGVPYRDNIRPVIRGVKIYPADGGQAVDAPAGSTVAIGGPFYIGVYSTDAAEGSTPKNGPDRVEIEVDGEPFFKYTTEGFVIDSGRMVNACIDFPLFARTRQPYLISRVLPGAAGEWVPLHKNGGIVDFKTDSVHHVKVRVYDIKNNCAERAFWVRHDASLRGYAHLTSRKPNMNYRKPYSRSLEAFKVEVPAYTLYANDYIHTATERYTHYISPVCTVEPWLNRLPPQRAITVSIRKTSSANINPQKVTIVHIGNNNKLNAYATTYDDGWYTAKPREFGRFVLMADTDAPVIKALNFGKSKKSPSLLRVKITDNLSGVETYNCYINGKWILGEYDGKTATVTVNVGNHLKAGENTFVVEATDAVGNTEQKEWSLHR